MEIPLTRRRFRLRSANEMLPGNSRNSPIKSPLLVFLKRRTRFNTCDVDIIIQRFKLAPRRRRFDPELGGPRAGKASASPGGRAAATVTSPARHVGCNRFHGNRRLRPLLYDIAETLLSRDGEAGSAFKPRPRTKTSFKTL